MTQRGGRTLRRRPRWAAIGLGLMLAQAGCDLHSVDVPDVEGPSEEGFSIQLALSKDIDFSRPDADEVKLRAAILKSEGLPRVK